MILKPADVGKLRRNAEHAPWCVLVFGDDEGVVSDTADQVVAAWTKSAGRPSNQITLDDDDVRREPHLLSDPIETASLLGDLDIVRIRTTGEKIAKHILALVEHADAHDAAFANRLIVLCGGLNKKSKLRAGFESARSSAAIHVFADSADSIRDIVLANLKQLDVEIENDALTNFIAHLPGHRGLANQETEKLALFGRGLGRPINSSDIRALSLTDADHSVRDLVQAALDGDRNRCLAEYDRLTELNTSAISVLRILEMEVKRLLQARGLLGTGGDIGRKLRPPVWQSEWPVFRSRLDRWSAMSLTRLLAAIHDLELQAKQAGPAADPALRILLLDIVKSAAQRSRAPA